MATNDVETVCGPLPVPPSGSAPLRGSFDGQRLRSFCVPSARWYTFRHSPKRLCARSMEAATRLEELWNEMIDRHDVALLCTYSMDSPLERMPHSLVALHSHNIPQRFVTSIPRRVDRREAIRERRGRARGGIQLRR